MPAGSEQGRRAGSMHGQDQAQRAVIFDAFSLKITALQAISREKYCYAMYRFIIKIVGPE